MTNVIGSSVLILFLALLYLPAGIQTARFTDFSVIHPVVDFMAIDDYVALLKQCGFAIMNHKRQKAVGNIVIMLYLGARVFLREENPAYQMLKNDGVMLNTITELEQQPGLLKTPLSETEIQTNISILYKHWSKQAIDVKTNNLVEFHLGAKA